MLLFFFVALVMMPACATKRTLQREYRLPPGGEPTRKRVVSIEEREKATIAPAIYYTIAPWYGFKEAACSLTFDDGTLDQYTLAFPELEKRGLKATFFLMTRYRRRGYWYDGETKRRMFSWNQARRIQEAGHEVGSHSRTHADLTKKNSLLRWEIGGSLIRLQKEIHLLEGVTFAWPYWRSNEECRDVAAEYYLAARAGTGLVENYGSTLDEGVIDLFSVDSLCMRAGQYYGPWRAQSEKVRSNGGWLVLCFHGIDDWRIDREWLGWDPLTIYEFRETLDYVESNGFWIAPFGFVTRYIRERHEAVLSLVDASWNRIIVVLDDELDDEIYCQTLSLKVELPHRWPDLRVSKHREEIPHIRTGDGAVLFDALPDGSSIYIERIE
jgi:peptidoglycan/xylan/chitin deacetylase (PgdA/CDA1 family)